MRQYREWCVLNAVFCPSEETAPPPIFGLEEKGVEEKKPLNGFSSDIPKCLWLDLDE